MAIIKSADFTIELPSTDNYDAEDIGLMLVDDPSEGKRYHVEFAETLTPQLQTGDVSWASFPAKQELNMPQQDWRKGMGAIIARGDNHQQYLAAINADASGISKIIPGPLVQQATGATLDGTPIQIFEASGVPYCVAGEKIYSITGGTISEVWSGCGTTITHVAVFDKVYIAIGGTNKFYYSSDMSTFTEASDSDSKADYFVTFDYYLGKTINPNKFSYSIDPSAANANWSVADTIGDASHNFTGGAISSEGELYFGKTNGLWNIDTAGIVHSFYNAPYVTTTNYNPIKEWQGSIFYPAGNGGFYHYNITTGQSLISPALYARDARGYTGSIMACAGDSEWLYVVTTPLSGEDAKLLKVRLENVDGEVDWRWHGALAQIPTDNTRDMFVHNPSSGNPILYICGLNSTSKEIYYIVLPTNYAGIDDDDNYKLIASAQVELSNFSKDLDLIKKALFGAQLQSKNLSDNTTVEFDYKLDDANDWTNLGTFTTSPQEVIEFPKNTSAYKIQPRLTINGFSSQQENVMSLGYSELGTASLGGSITAVRGQIIGINIKGRLETDELRTIDCIVQVAGMYKYSNGKSSKINAEYLHARLYEMANLDYPVKIWDYTTRTALYADVMSPTPKTINVKQMGGRFTEAIHLNFLEAPITI